MIKLTPFERDVMHALLAGEDHLLSLLRNQLERVSSVSRKETGVGFYITFDIPKDIPKTFEIDPLIKHNFCFGDVDASLEGLKNGAGFLLWIADGYLSQLEGYTYGENWPSQIKSYNISYRDNKRDIYSLKKEWLS